MEWSEARTKHGRQKVCPQGVVTGSYSSFRHSVQSMSSPRSRPRLQAQQSASLGPRLVLAAEPLLLCHSWLSALAPCGGRHSCC